MGQGEQMTKRRKITIRAALAALAASGLALLGVQWASAAGAPAGSAIITDPATDKALGAGGSATPWTVTFLSQGASNRGPVFCSGDTASKAYHVFGYIVPVSVDPSTLTFNAASGPSQGFPL